MKSNRRAFLKASATFLATAPALVRGRNLNSKLQIASVGTDGQGYVDISRMADHSNAIHVAFCDVDLARTQKALDTQPEAKVYQNFKNMFSELEDKIDPVS